MITESKHTMRGVLPALLGLMLAAVTGQALAESRQDEQLSAATAILGELRSIPERAIPPALLDRAHAIAIIPDMIKIGVGLAGRHGRGVLSVRQEDGWSAPVFIKLSGGSIGWQAGLQSSDLVLVFTNERGVRNITRGKFTLGADASIAAGPVGRHGSAATDQKLSAEVYSYSRARGLFAGVSVEGAALRIDKGANAAFYVQPAISAEDVLAGRITSMPDQAVKFIRGLPHTSARLASNETPTATPAGNAPAVSSENEPAKTYALGERAAEGELP